MSLLHSLTERLGAVEAVDGVADPLGRGAAALTSAPEVKTALSAAWLGHRLHPLLTDAVIGTWLSAGLLDALDRDDGRSSEALIAAGLVSAVPTVAAGLSDYSDLSGRARRVAAVHAVANALAGGLQAASLLARRAGARRSGRLLSLAALAVTGASGYLGGHLSYAMGVGVDHTAFNEGPDDWTATVPAAEVGSEPKVVAAGEREVLLLRDGDTVVALDNRCSHAGWRLSGGSVDDGCITCPAHGSTFRFDGQVVRGPAASPQPTFAVRVRDGVVEIKAEAARSA